MPLSPGTRLGSYEILSALGAGGMGEVYRARDMRLGREVAIKILLDAVALDPERISRFEREAKALAALNHPHVAALHGMEESDRRHFLVMELVEGETLAERLQRGALPIEQTLRIAAQIAEALEAAHEKGIVHRDLKPANVKITPDEKVKVLDFGLAKAMETESKVGNLTHSPTLSMMATQAGVIMGTAAYMSPEQARGLPADYRSDVFSFGVVFYEMLTGRQPFQGETAPDILASVLARDPDVTLLPPNLNPRVHELVSRCLNKNAKRRWQSIGDVRAEIEIIAADPRGASSRILTMAPQRPLWKRAIPIAGAALLASAITGAIAWSLRPSPAPRVVTRFPLALTEGQQFSNTGRQVVALSPDGSRLVFVANQRLYLRSMRDLEARPIPGTDGLGGVTAPVFSPDGESIAFWATSDGAIKRIGIMGGAPVTICSADNPFGMVWAGDAIVFGQGGKGILRVSATGGKPESIATVSSGELAHGPQLLPGGEALLFTLADGPATGAAWDKAKTVVQSLRTGLRKVLIDGGSDARYVPPNHIVYALGGVLFAVPFDLKRLAVTGGAVPIVEGVRRSGGGQTGTAQFSFSDTGSLAYVPGSVIASSSQVVIGAFDRTGAGQALKLPPGPYDSPRLSPDRKQIGFSSDDGKEAIIWVYDLSGTSSMRRLTFGGRNRFPIWSADSRRIAFQSDRDGDPAIFWQAADGTGTAERLTKPETGTSHAPESWSPKGDRFLFSVSKGPTNSLWAFSLPDRKATLFGSVDSIWPTGAVFSPDGEWVAYASREAKQASAVVYVQPFPATGAKYQISKDSEDGHHPLWTADGRELFFTAGPGRFSVVSVTTKPSFTFGIAEQVEARISLAIPASRRPYDIGPDGKGLIGMRASDQTGSPTATTPQIQVVLNWTEELRVRVPAK